MVGVLACVSSLTTVDGIDVGSPVEAVVAVTAAQLVRALLAVDLVPGSGDGHPGPMANVNGTLFFTAIDPVYGRELWKSDGTEAGTYQVRDIYAGPGSSFWDPSGAVVHNGALLFRANDGVGGEELWRATPSCL